jgi:hypothetical protein
MDATLPTASPDVLALIHKKLNAEGYALTNDGDLGLAKFAREHIHTTYFNDRHLRRYSFDIPEDRERARDVVRYTWRGDAVVLNEHDTVAIEGRGDQPFRREFERVRVLEDDHFRAWIATALSLVPADRRQHRGTFGVNLFRTHTQVVTKPHQDEEEYILIYVLERVGGGAESELYRIGSNDFVHHSTLEPGDLIIFKDSEFLHTALPLKRPDDGREAHRDVLVCTVNYPHTYPLPD